MSDAFSPEPTPDSAAAVPGAARELDVDLAAFLPEGVELGDPSDLDPADGEIVDVGELEAVIETPDGIVVVDEVVVATEAGVVVVDEIVAVVEEPSPPAVDLEALSQIERDLDAVDAAIAALDAGTYGTDPSTGQLIDDALLAENPTRLS